MLFHCNTDEGLKKKRFPAGTTISVVCNILIYVCMGLLWILWFLPRTKDVHVRWTGVSTLSQFEWVWGVVTLWRKGVLSRVGPALYPELPGEALATPDPELQ